MYFMKKSLVQVLAIFVLFGLVGCMSLSNAGEQNSSSGVSDIEPEDSPNAKPPTVMISGTLFTLCSRRTIVNVTSEDREAEIDGRITSHVLMSEWPHLNNQSNIDFLLNAPYIIKDNDVIIFFEYEQEWFLFRRRGVA